MSAKRLYRVSILSEIVVAENWVEACTVLRRRGHFPDMCMGIHEVGSALVAEEEKAQLPLGDHESRTVAEWLEMSKEDK